MSRPTSKIGRQNATCLLAILVGVLLLALPAVQYEAGSLRAADVSARVSGASLRTTIALLRALQPLDSRQRELAAQATGSASYEALVETSESNRHRTQALQATVEDLQTARSVASCVLYGLPALASLGLLVIGISGWQNDSESDPSAPSQSLAAQKVITAGSHQVPPGTLQAVGLEAVAPLPARETEDILPLRQREFLVISPKAVRAADLANAILSIDGRALGAENVYPGEGFDLIEIQTRSDVSFFNAAGGSDTGAIDITWPSISQGVRLQVLLQISASAFLDDFEALALEVSTAIRAGKAEDSSISGLAGLCRGFAFRVPGVMAETTTASMESGSDLTAGIRFEHADEFLTEADVDAYLSSLTEDDLRAITLGSGVFGSDVEAEQARDASPALASQVELGKGGQRRDGGR